MTDRGGNCTVIIVTYNSAAVIRECLDQLDVAAHPGFDVLVIDNCSNDATLDILKSRGDISYMRNNSNVGFARAVNIAAAQVTTPFVALLNPDCGLAGSTMDALIQVLQGDSKVGIVAPIVRHPEGRTRVLSCGREPTVWRMFCHFFGLSRLDPGLQCLEGAYLLPRQVREGRDVDWVTGAVMVVRSQAWRELHGLCERWFMYAEDIELCHRIRRHGWTVRVDPRFEALHMIGGSSGDEPRLGMNPSWIVNLSDYYRSTLAPRHIRLPYVLSWRLVAGIGLAARSLGYLLLHIVHREESRVDWAWEARRFAYFARVIVSLRSTTPS